MTPPPLKHQDPHKPDERLAAEAAAHLSRAAGLQLVAELLTRLREMDFPWWTPEQLRQAYPASERMHWLIERPDVRQRITTQLTGLAPRAARNKTVEFQAALIDSVVDEGDISLEDFEAAFEPIDLAVYGPAADFFRLFKKRMPWDDDATPHQDLVGWLIGAFLADKCSLDGTPRAPIFSALAARTAIDGRVWHTRIPLHVRVAIDEARFTAQRDRPQEPYGVERDLAIATPALIAASVPLRDLINVVETAALAVGFEDAAPPPSRSFGREHTSRPSTPPRAESEDGPGTLIERVAPAEPPRVLAPPAVVADVIVEPPAVVAATMSEPSRVAEPPRIPEPPVRAPESLAGLRGLADLIEPEDAPSRIFQPLVVPVAPPAFVAPPARISSPPPQELDASPRDTRPPSAPEFEDPPTDGLDDSAISGIAEDLGRRPPEVSELAETSHPSEEMEHTNPWAVPSPTDLARAAQELRDKEKDEG